MTCDEIAATLGVKSVLEGSVRRSSDRLRVTAQLINATDGAPLWSGRYDRDASDVFAIQDEIAQAIIAALEVVLLPSRVHRGRRAANAAANDAYLKGRHHRFNFTHGSLQRSLEFLQEAVTLDPDFALARCDIAWTCLTLAVSGVMTTDDAVARMRREASLALAVEPRTARGAYGGRVDGRERVRLVRRRDRIPACPCGRSRVTGRTIPVRAVVL